MRSLPPARGRVPLLAAILVVVLAAFGGTSAFADPEVCNTEAGFQVCVTVSDSSMTGDVAVSARYSCPGGGCSGGPRIGFFLDGAPNEYLLIDFKAPYAFTLKSARFADGTYNLRASVMSSSNERLAVASVTKPVTLANGNSSKPGPPSGFAPHAPSGANPGDPITVIATGDGVDGEQSSKDVATLVASLHPDMVLYLGDVYEAGSQMEFENWYGRGATSFLGRFHDITNPSIGNHDYNANGYVGGPSNNLDGYNWYWNSPPPWYAFDANGWRLYALNSDPRANLASERTWFENDLKTHQNVCSLAFHHHPRWSIGPQGPNPAVDPFWRLFNQYGVDLDLTGHDHSYQRFQPLDADGNPSPTGTTSFVSGSGGHGTQDFVANPGPGGSADLVKSFAGFANGIAKANGASVYGVLKLQLYPGKVDWSFVKVGGGVFESGTVVCGDASPPSAPTGLRVTDRTPTAVGFAWNASTDNVGVTGYAVYRGSQKIATTTDTAFADTGLTPKTAYSYRVRALDAQGNASGYSSTLNVSTLPPDRTAPTRPTNAVAQVIDANTVRLAWTAATDNVAVTGYDVYLAGGTDPIGTTAGTSFDHVVPAGTTASYEIVAFDEAGNRSARSVASVAVTTPLAFSAGIDRVDTGAKGTVTITAHVRTNGLTGRVRLTLAPYPKGVKLPEVTIAPGGDRTEPLTLRVLRVPPGTYRVEVHADTAVAGQGAVAAADLNVAAVRPSLGGRPRVLLIKKAKKSVVHVGTLVRCAVRELNGWPQPTVHYAWLMNGKTIRGAARATFRPRTPGRLSCRVRARNSAGLGRGVSRPRSVLP